LKAIALGAQFVFLGRPFLFAATIAGEPGVRDAIKLLQHEIDRDMALRYGATWHRDARGDAAGSLDVRVRAGFLEK